MPFYKPLLYQILGIGLDPFLGIGINQKMGMGLYQILGMSYKE
jgi:hypothetical protein